jgi:glyoxylase-like metal-dependent hydrolase (beta-lactamase superfamily II)
MKPSIQVYKTSGGASIYRLPLEVFPGFWAYAHLVCADDVVALVDVGSGFGESSRHLEAAMAAVRAEHGAKVGWDDLTHILITHGHIDHFGGLPYVRRRCSAPIGVHELDFRILTNYEERLSVVARRLRAFLAEAGVPASERREIMSLYLLNKGLFTSVQVDLTYEAAGMQIGPLRFTHVPGHCPGHVVIQVDDVLLAGDHVLSGISPHQAPERLSMSTGLGHYLESLDRLRPLAGAIRLTLGGHQEPIEDLDARIMAIKRLHQDRLGQVLELMQEAKTIAQVAGALFPKAHGYHELLALEEAGAHVEYLAQRGYLRIENRQELEEDGPVLIRYRRLDGSTPPLPDFRAHPGAMAAGEPSATGPT